MRARKTKLQHHIQQKVLEACCFFRFVNFVFECFLQELLEKKFATEREALVADFERCFVSISS